MVRWFLSIVLTVCIILRIYIITRRIIMLKRVATCLIPVLVGAFVGVASTPMEAQSATNGGGLLLHAYFPSDAGCFTTSSYGGIVNNCPSARWLSTSLSVPSGWHTTSVSIFGSNSMCLTVSTNGVGNGANVGANTWTVAGPQTWQTLSTGDRFVWDWSPVVFECLLESGGVVGSFTAL
jgi:hypothetical protein